MKMSQTVFSLQSGHEYMVEMVMLNVQRIITPKVGNPEPRLMCSAHCLIVLNICVKFGENVMNSIGVMERTRVHGRNGYVQCSKGNNSISRQARIIVHVFCTLSHGVLHWCEVLRKYLKWYQSYRADTKLWSADGRTDTQNFGRYNIIPHHFSWRGIKNAKAYYRPVRI